MKWPAHGGQPHLIKQMFNNVAQGEILDLSANLNPLGPPEWLREELLSFFDSCQVYPDPTYLRPRQAIADHESLDVEQVLLTNGGAEAIFLVAKYLEQKKALIIQPTFSEYEQACRHYHLGVEYLTLDANDDFCLPVEQIRLRMPQIDALFLCRPNNPTGTVIPEEEMSLILEEALSNQVIVIVDEAFADFFPPNIRPLTSWIQRFPNLILLRSLTKLYTIPGMRVGYLLGKREIVKQISKYQMPWSVNAFAAGIIPRLLEDKEFVHATVTWLQTEWSFLKDQYDQLAFYYSPTCVNFYLLRDQLYPDKTQELYLYLLQEGVLARHTTTFYSLEGDYLRLAVRSRAENSQLLVALKKWREIQC